MPAQFYPECAQIQITGGGNVPPPASILVSFPGAYSAEDPVRHFPLCLATVRVLTKYRQGILINIYTQLNDYKIPGPAPFGTAAPTVATTAWPTKATWNTASQPSTVPSNPTKVSVAQLQVASTTAD